VCIMQGRKKLGAILEGDQGICKGGSVCGKKVYNLIPANIHLHPPSAFEGGVANVSLSSICIPSLALEGGANFVPMTPKKNVGLGAKKHKKRSQTSISTPPSAPSNLEFFQRVFKGGCDRTDAASPLPTPLAWMR
jgi:hypothetical protein